MRNALNMPASLPNCIAIAAILLMWIAPPNARADAPPRFTAVPQTQPSAGSAAAAPTPQPPQKLAAKVLVLPFQTVEARPGDQWIARSIQQSVLTDLMTGGPMPLSLAARPATDLPGATDAGRKAGDRYVIDGLIHLNPTGGKTAVRVTGQLISAETGQPIAAVKATGTLDNLFSLEDELGAQFRQCLNEASRAATARPAEPAPQIPFSGPVTSSPEPRYPWDDYGPPNNVPPGAMERYYDQVPFPNGFPYYDSAGGFPFSSGYFSYPYFGRIQFFTRPTPREHFGIGERFSPRTPHMTAGSAGRSRGR